MGYQTIFIMTEYPHNKEMVIIKSGLMPDDLAERGPVSGGTSGDALLRRDEGYFIEGQSS